MSEMRRVNQAHRCPACGHDTWCLLGRSIIICMRNQSDREYKFKGGEIGWKHPYANGEAVERPAYRVQKKTPTINARRVLYDWGRACPDRQLPFLANNLGVSVRSLEGLECHLVPDYASPTWGFPMKDGYGNYIGIRLRNLTGRKWAVLGSQAGIFIPTFPPCPRVFVLEGPTDTAAALTLGLSGIGRPSCSGGVVHVVDYVRRHHTREVVIISDNDGPGIRGAKDLQRWLPCPSCVIVLPTKDLREFLKVGDHSTIDSMIEQLVWTQPATSSPS